MSTQQSARIINTDAGRLTGFELYTLLLNAKYKFRRGPESLNPTPQNVINIEENLITYFEMATLVQFQSQETLMEFVKLAQRYKLTDDEILKIINACPTNVIELHLLIDDFEQRLGMAKAEQLVQEINAKLYLDRRNPAFNPANFVKEVEETTPTLINASLPKLTTTHPKGGPPTVDPLGPPVKPDGLPRMKWKSKKPKMKDPSPIDLSTQEGEAQVMAEIEAEAERYAAEATQAQATGEGEEQGPARGRGRGGPMRGRGRGGPPKGRGGGPLGERGRGRGRGGIPKGRVRGRGGAVGPAAGAESGGETAASEAPTSDAPPAAYPMPVDE